MLSKSEVLTILKKLKHECESKHIVMLASSSSFFLILTFVPFILLLTRALGIFFGPEGEKFQLIMDYLAQLTPPNLNGVLVILENLLKNALYAKTKFTTLNLFFLLISSFGFINSVWRAMAIITEERAMRSFKRLIKGLGALGISFTFFLIIFWIPILMRGINYVLSLKYIQDFIEFLHLEKILDMGVNAFFGIDIFSYALIIFFFAILFKYILHPRVNFKSALVGASFFGFSMVGIKSSFYFYVDLTKNGLVQNYGASYTFVLMFIWIFVSMIIFYFSVIFSLVFHESRGSKKL
jgi:membrane protein